MKEPTLLKIDRVKLADLVVRDRLRPVSEAGIASLMASIHETGVMKDAIHVRKIKSGELVLLAGAHRVEAAKRLGWEDIEAKVWTDVTSDWARLIEIDDNLAGAEMDALDTSLFLAERKQVYEKMHPETRAEAFRGNQHTGKLAADIMSVATFAQATAEKFGLTERHVRRLVEVGTKLTADQVRWLRSAPKRPGIVDLQALAKIGEAEERSKVCIALSNGDAKTVAAARQQYAVARGHTEPIVHDPVDVAFKRLFDVWKRAPMAARRRFVSDVFAELNPLVVDEAEKRDAADIAALRRDEEADE